MIYSGSLRSLPTEREEMLSSDNQQGRLDPKGVQQFCGEVARTCQPIVNSLMEQEWGVDRQWLQRLRRADADHRADLPWVVLEGDNGVGKDTLAARLEGDGWRVLNRTPQAMEALTAARNAPASQRTSAYMQLNRCCALLASLSDDPCLLVRYWPSTLNAAFVTGLIDEPGMRQVAGLLAHACSMPDLVLRLDATQEERARRIHHRGPVGGKLDDVSLEKDTACRFCLALVSEFFPDWEDLDTTGRSPAKVHRLALELLHRHRLTP